MRYWGFLAAKLGVSGALMYGLLRLLTAFWPRPAGFLRVTRAGFGYDLWFTAAVGVWFLLASGALYLVIRDQRYRCRVCLRRLRMPVQTGSWSKMLQFGRPHTEYICPYGHGTLAQPEVLFSGMDNAEWKPHGEIWEELFAVSDREDRR
jgi:hypothetical protein